MKLLAEQELALALLHALVHVAADALGDVELGEMRPAPLDELGQALLDLNGLEQEQLLLERQIRGVAGQVSELARFGHALDRIDDLPGSPLLKDRDDDVLVLTGELAHGLAAADLLEHLCLDPQRRSRSGHPRANAGARDGPQHGGRLTTGELAELVDRRNDADDGVPAVETGNDEDLVLTSRVGGVDGRLPLRVVEGDGHDHAWQHDHIGERQNRELLSC